MQNLGAVVSPSPASSLPNLAGQKIGRFQIGERLGSGGMGEVYRAEDTVLKRTVAVKRLSHRTGDSNSQQRFLREAERASALVNPHIAAVYDVIEHGGEFLIVMELVAGVPLRARLS